MARASEAGPCILAKPHDPHKHMHARRSSAACVSILTRRYNDVHHFNLLSFFFSFFLLFTAHFVRALNPSGVWLSAEEEMAGVRPSTILSDAQCSQRSPRQTVASGAAWLAHIVAPKNRTGEADGSAEILTIFLLSELIRKRFNKHTAQHCISANRIDFGASSRFARTCFFSHHQILQLKLSQINAFQGIIDFDDSAWFGQFGCETRGKPATARSRANSVALCMPSRPVVCFSACVRLFLETRLIHSFFVLFFLPTGGDHK